MRSEPGGGSCAAFILNWRRGARDLRLSVDDVTAKLATGPRRAAGDQNLLILKRHLYADTLVHDGDRIEIVNFVGGG